MARKENEFAASFALDLGVDRVSHETSVQPFGERAALVQSTNTRLNKVRGVPTKAPGAVAMTDPASPHAGSTACGGIIPCGHVSSSLVIRQREYGPQRIADTALEALRPPLSVSVQSFWSADVSRAGSVPARGQYRDPAVCLLNGQMWFASVRTDTSGIGIFVSVIGSDGQLVAAPHSVLTLGSGVISAPPWVGITAHGVNGIRLWYRNGTSAAVLIRTLTLANGVVTAGSSTSLYTPAGAGDQTYDVVAHDASTAWLLTLSSALTTSIALHKVAVTTNTITTTTATAVTSTTASRLAVKSATLTAGDRVAVAVSLVAGTNTYLMYDGTASNLYTITGRLTYGDVAVGFYKLGATEFAVFGVSDTSGTSGSLSSFPNYTALEFRGVSSPGSLSATATMPWTRFVSRMDHLAPSADEIYPVFVGQGCWDDSGQRSELNANFLTDPAIDVYRVDSTSQVSRIGRFGVDRAHIYSITGSTGAAYNAQTACVEGNKYAFVYAESTGILPDTDFPLRYVEMDFAARQPRHALGADGVCIVAGALPVEWDGVSFSEICAPLRMRVFGLTSGGSGAAPLAGAYLVSAVIVWRDAAGVKHRGMPSRLITLTMNGADSWVIDVALPYVFRDGVAQDKFEIELYATEKNGTVLYRIIAGTVSLTDYVATFAGTTSPSVSGTTPIIYSDAGAGAVLPSQQPGAFHDVAIVTDRAWALNAERRSEWWYSQPKQDGVSYEWSSELKLYTPPSAGKGVAVVEMGGSTLLLCENGVWVVNGLGPDATLGSDAFNAPEQLSDIGCSDRGSVVRTPVGVMFISNSRFAIVGATQRTFEQIDASLVGTTVPVLLRDTQEVVWFSSTGTHYVYNYALDRWTTWDSNVCPAVSAAAYDPVSGLVNMVRASDGAVMQMDPNGVSATAQKSFTTGRAQFGGPEDDNVVNDVLIRARTLGLHGVAVTITPDYGTETFTSVFDATQITACVEGDQYTLCVSPGRMAMRACRVLIEETGATGEAFQPISVTFVGGKNGGPKRDAVRPDGRA